MLRPTIIRDRDFPSEVERAGKSCEGIGPHGEDLRPGAAGYAPQRREQQQK